MNETPEERKLKKKMKNKNLTEKDIELMVAFAATKLKYVYDGDYDEMVRSEVVGILSFKAPTSITIINEANALLKVEDAIYINNEDCALVYGLDQADFPATGDYFQISSNGLTDTYHAMSAEEVVKELEDRGIYTKVLKKLNYLNASSYLNVLLDYKKIYKEYSKIENL